jgi:hypothetical protein
MNFIEPESTITEGNFSRTSVLPKKGTMISSEMKTATRESITKILFFSSISKTLIFLVLGINIFFSQLLIIVLSIFSVSFLDITYVFKQLIEFVIDNKDV